MSWSISFSETRWARDPDTCTTLGRGRPPLPPNHQNLTHVAFSTRELGTELIDLTQGKREIGCFSLKCRGPNSKPPQPVAEHCPGLFRNGILLETEGGTGGEPVLPPATLIYLLGCQLLLPVPHFHGVPPVPTLLHNLWWLPTALKDYSHPPPGLPGPALSCPKDSSWSPLPGTPSSSPPSSFPPFQTPPILWTLVPPPPGALYLPELTSSWGL